jgi:hypothetical protein
VVCASGGGATAAEEAEKTKEVIGRNPYDVLGIDVTSSKRAARQAFRALAKDAHPDTGGSAEAFDVLKTAADILTDDDARAAGLSLTPGGGQLGNMDHTGCHQSVRPTRVGTPGGCQIGYMAAINWCCDCKITW